MLNPHVIFLALACNLIGGTGYIIATVQGKTKPNRVTWLLWALAPLIAFSAQLSQGVGLSALMTLMVGVGPLAVFISSFVNKNSYWKISRLDIACGLFSLLALILWGVTRTGNIVIVFSIASDALAAIPTLVKAWHRPETENYKAFLGGIASASITLLTISDWKFATYGFPFYILLVCIVLVVVIAFPKFRPFSSR